MRTTSTRTTTFSRWSMVAVAAVALTSLMPLYAQNEKKDEKKKAPPPAAKSAPVQQANPPASRPAPPPQNTPPVRTPPPQNIPPMRTAPPAENNPPVRTPPPNRQPQFNPPQSTPVAPPRERPQSDTTPPVRQPGTVDNNNRNPVRQPGTVNNPNTNPNQGRQFGTPNTNPNNNNPNNAVRPPATVNNPSTNPNQGRQFGTPNNSNPNQGRQFGNTGGNRPAPPGTVTRAPNRPPVYHGPDNTQVSFHSNGQPREVRARDMTIVHSSSGARRVVVERPDHTVIVTNNAGHGYVQRPFMVRNTTLVQRTYYVRGTPYTRVYRPYVFRGVSLNLYVTNRYYAPAFYTWAYNPWPAPVVYRWGWSGSPWYGYYGGYFTPYPSYTSAAFWLTDYLVAASLERAYQERMDAQASANAQAYGDYGPTPMTSDVKQAIADEVRRQLDQERSEGQAVAQNADYSGAPSFLTDNSTHVFIVASSLDVSSRDGECPVTEGDVLQLTNAMPATATSADVLVLASKGGDCHKGSVVSVAVADLQDMQNRMRETLDQGLSDLQSGQGQSGIPTAPPAARTAPVQSPYAAAAPPPDANVASELSQQAQAATQAEGEVLGQAQAAVADNTVPTVAEGMTIEQVVAILGKPLRIGDLGSKKTYFYQDMKVIFTDGKVTDIQ